MTVTSSRSLDKLATRLRMKSLTATTLLAKRIASEAARRRPGRRHAQSYASLPWAVTTVGNGSRTAICPDGIRKCAWTISGANRAAMRASVRPTCCGRNSDASIRGKKKARMVFTADPFDHVVLGNRTVRFPLITDRRRKRHDAYDERLVSHFRKRLGLTQNENAGVRIRRRWKILGDDQQSHVSETESRTKAPASSSLPPAAIRATPPSSTPAPSKTSSRVYPARSMRCDVASGFTNTTHGPASVPASLQEAKKRRYAPDCVRKASIFGGQDSAPPGTSCTSGITCCLDGVGRFPTGPRLTRRTPIETMRRRTSRPASDALASAESLTRQKNSLFSAAILRSVASAASHCAPPISGCLRRCVAFFHHAADCRGVQTDHARDFGSALNGETVINDRLAERALHRNCGRLPRAFVERTRKVANTVPNRRRRPQKWRRNVPRPYTDRPSSSRFAASTRNAGPSRTAPHGRRNSRSGAIVRERGFVGGIERLAFDLPVWVRIEHRLYAERAQSVGPVDINRRPGQPLGGNRRGDQRVSRSSRPNNRPLGRVPAACGRGYRGGEHECCEHLPSFEDRALYCIGPKWAFSRPRLVRPLGRKSLATLRLCVREVRSPTKLGIVLHDLHVMLLIRPLSICLKGPRGLGPDILRKYA